MSSERNKQLRTQPCSITYKLPNKMGDYKLLFGDIV